MEENNICRFIPRHNDYEAVHTINFVLERKQQKYENLKMNSVYRMHLVIAGKGILHTPGCSYSLKKGDIFGTVKIIGSPAETVETVLSEGYTALFSEVERESLRLEANLPNEREAPVEKGEKLGTAILFLGEGKLAEIDLLAKEAVEGFTFSQRMERLAENWLMWRKF